MLAYNAAAFAAQADTIRSSPADAKLSPTWTTKCTATQQSNIEVIAVCDPLATGAGVLLLGAAGSSALAMHVEDHEQAVNTLSRLGFTVFTENDLTE